MRTYWERLYPLQLGKVFTRREEIGDLFRLRERWDSQLRLFWNKMNSSIDESPIALTRNLFGYHCIIKPSDISNAGRGLFLKGYAKRGDLISLYPGMVFNVFEDPIFWCSIRNQYIIQTSYQHFIDGKGFGLSGYLYRSVVARESVDGVGFADVQWQNEDHELTPMSLGQIANNSYDTNGPNVTYLEHELKFSTDQSDQKLLKHVPNVSYQTLIEPEDRISRITCLLIATRDINDGDEILASYV